MSILIKGMGMPDNCALCPMWDAGNCLASSEAIICEYDKRPQDCPLVNVPQHGRLIDADALKLMFPAPDEANGGWRNPDEALVHKTGVWAIIDSAPEIVPSEGADE